MPPLLSVIVPAHNEETRLPESLRRIHAFLATQPYPSEIIVVENGSIDRTLDVAQAAAREHSNLQVHHEAQSGKGRAVRRGMLTAEGEYRFICDADLSMPIEEVVRFLPPHQPEADIAIASREAPGARRYGEPAYRHWIGRGFNLLVQALALPGFQDTQCGFKCFRAAVAEELFRLQRLDGWTFDVEVLFIAARRGYHIVEVPIPWYYVRGSRVHVMRDSLAMFLDLLRIRWNAARRLYDLPR